MSAPSSNPCHVFTPDWIEEQKRKYDQHPDYARPKRYHFWTSDECRRSRDLIEQWVDLLPLRNRQQFIPRLRTSEQFEQTYNELAVGDSLRRMGHSVEYEVELQGLTPDWLVRPARTGPEFIVEVVSSKPPEERSRCDDGWDALRCRFEALSDNSFLCIEPPFGDVDDEPVAPPVMERQKQIVRDVQKWLETGPLEGDQYTIGGIIIHFAERHPDLEHIVCSISCVPFCVDAAPLKESVRKKARTYRKVVQGLRIPFVVCVIPDFDSGRGLDDLQNVVLGEERLRLWRDRQGVCRPEYYRDNNGLFAKYPTLSAVTLGMWKDRRFSHVVLPNSDALYPLNERAIPPGRDCAKGA
jgi:hypothetical protein